MGPGIAVHMVTGDHPSTVQTITRQVEILPAHFNAVADVVDTVVRMTSQFDELPDREKDLLLTLPLLVAPRRPKDV